jgi:hypothetical protein
MATVTTPLLIETRAASTSSASSASSHEKINLIKFRRAVGINVDPATESSYTDLETARRSARGLYKDVIDLQRWRAQQHRFFEAVFFCSLASQIVIGAVLTALGPQAKDHSTAITVLGVFNTITAGVLTAMKGQGLPDRFRKDEYQMKKVQDFIEELDVRLSLEGADVFTSQELDDVVQQIWQKYNAAVDTAEMNKPNNYAQQREGDARAKDKDGKKIETRYSMLKSEDMEDPKSPVMFR